MHAVSHNDRAQITYQQPKIVDWYTFVTVENSQLFLYMSMVSLFRSNFAVIFYVMQLSNVI